MSAEQRLVEILPYDPNWPRLFEEEISVILPIFQSIHGVSAGNSESLAQRVYGNSESAAKRVSGNSESLVPQVVIHHIGSTSVPGLAAKPIIDMLPGVADIEQVDGLNVQLENIEYQAMGEYGLPGRRYFRKLDGARHLVHLHCYLTGNPEITRHLAYRDYLRAHLAVAREYGELKIKLAAQYPRGSEDYQSGKDSFVTQLERVALEWQGL